MQNEMNSNSGEMSSSSEESSNSDNNQIGSDSLSDLDLQKKII
jgi:hypothetical protein